MNPCVAASCLFMLLAGCDGRPPLGPGDGPPLDPVAFFAGRSHGEAVLKIVLKAPVPVRVDSDGRSDGHGGLVLIQSIREGTKPPRQRSWHIRPVGRGRFTGTLTDATGPVSAIARGSLLHIRYTMKNGMKVDQWLALRRGGKALDNRLDVTKWGMHVATLDETIRKLD